VLTGVGAFMAGHDKGHAAGTAEVTQAWDRQKATDAEAYGKAMVRLVDRNITLAAFSDALRKRQKDELARIDDMHRADIERMRDRPEQRAAGGGGLPETARSGVGATGQGLAGPDARFLVGFGADAGRLQLAYDECRAKYQKAQGLTNDRHPN
jgi:hypothetical protein